MTYRDMSDVTRIQYLRSELTVSPTVYDAASRILVGFINTNQFSPQNEKEVIEKSVKLALELAVTTDKIMELSASQGETL